jgi:hypothetical protein
VARTIAGAVALAPGVHGGIAGNAIQGAPSYDNVYLVTGVVVNENLRGQPHDLFIEDAIQETTVMTAGISAEYGRFTGGVISTITKSGGNEFTGSLRDSFTNPSWQKKTPWPTQGDPVDTVNEIYEETLGGYIIRDRLWFFGAGRQAEVSDQRFTSLTNIGYVHGVDESRLEGKLTGQITGQHSLMASYIDITEDEFNNSFGNIMDMASLVPVRSLPNTLMSLNYNGILTTNFLIEANLSQKEFAFVNSGSRFRDRIMGTLLVQSPGGRRWHSPTFCGVCTPEERNSEGWLGKGTYYLNTATLGNHTLVAGVENFAEERIANNHQSGSDFRIFTPSRVVNNVPFPVFDTRTEIAWTPILRFTQGTDLQTLSGFVNDRWDLNEHFSFNVGLRFDQLDAVDADGNTVADDSEFSPRLGMQYDIRGDGRHKISANYGRYVAKIADGNVGGSVAAAGNPGFIGWEYNGPVINGPDVPDSALLSTADALRLLFAWFESVGDTNNLEFLVEADVPGFSTRFDGPISSPSVDEFTLGYGVQLTTNSYIRTDYIHREWQNFYANRLDLSTGKSVTPFGVEGDVSVTTNDESIIREYDGFQVQGQWRPGRFNLGGSYTWSELVGNDQGESGPSATVRNTPLALFYPEYLSYKQRLPVGFLPEDIRHRAKIWAGYDLPTPVGNFNVSAVQTFETGSPYSVSGSIDASGRNTAFAGSPTNPGYTLSQLGTSHTYFFSGRGALRTDDFNRTDLALNYSLPIWRVEFFAEAEVFNIFDNDAVDNPNTTVLTRRTGGSASGLIAFNPFTTTPIECPQGAPAATCRDMGAHFQKSATFGNPTGPASYQDPREYQFSVGIRF